MGKMSSKKQMNISWTISGLLVGMAACLVLLMGTTMLLLSERIGESSVEILVSGIVLISSFGANLYTGKMHGEPLCAIFTQSTILIVLMLMGGCLIDGRFDGVWLRSGAVLMGGVSACVICLKKSRKQYKRKRRYS